MSTAGLESLDHTVQLTHLWINELDDRLGWSNKGRSYRLLRSVLQALRDWMTINESVDFAAQMPTLLRGVYYEHWRPSMTPVKHRSKTEFLARIDKAFVTDPLLDTAASVSVVFEFLSTKIGAGEIEDVRQGLPADLRKLWPGPSKAA